MAKKNPKKPKHSWHFRNRNDRTAIFAQKKQRNYPLLTASELLTPINDRKKMQDTSTS